MERLGPLAGPASHLARVDLIIRANRRIPQAPSQTGDSTSTNSKTGKTITAAVNPLCVGIGDLRVSTHLFAGAGGAFEVSQEKSRATLLIRKELREVLILFTFANALGG